MLVPYPIPDPSPETREGGKAENQGIDFSERTSPDFRGDGGVRKSKSKLQEQEEGRRRKMKEFSS